VDIAPFGGQGGRLGLMDSIAKEIIRQVLKKTSSNLGAGKAIV
jgi:hypothetical protein